MCVCVCVCAQCIEQRKLTQEVLSTSLQIVGSFLVSCVCIQSNIRMNYIHSGIIGRLTIYVPCQRPVPTQEVVCPLCRNGSGGHGWWRVVRLTHARDLSVHLFFLLYLPERKCATQLIYMSVIEQVYITGCQM